MLKSEFPQVRLIDNETNLGFSQAANQAAATAQGDYLAFLNNDMRVEKGWLKAMLQVVRPEKQIVCAGSTILTWDGTAIDFMGRPNDAFCLYYDSSEIPPTPGDLPFPDKYALFVSCGAAVILRSVFEEVGGFDPDFFLYQEDVDLCWRLWLKGYKVVMSSRSLVFHKSGATSSKLPTEFIYKLNRKHALFSLYKNLEKDELLELFPILLYYVLERSRFLDGGDQAIESVISEFASSIDLWIPKRNEVQESRVVTDNEIFSLLGHPLNFLLRGEQYEAVRQRLAQYSKLENFEPNLADSMRAALGQWLSGAHKEYERYLLREVQAGEAQRGSLVDQISERQSAVELLSAQLTERHQRVLALTEQVAERQRALQLPTEQLEKKEQALQTLSAELADPQRTIQTLHKQLENQRTPLRPAGANGAVAGSTSGGEDAAGQQLAAKLAETEQKYATQLARHQKAIDILSAQLEMRQSEIDKINGSMVWRVLNSYGRIKYRYLLPIFRLL
jgi:GT2 family glycosyltransferase